MSIFSPSGIYAVAGLSLEGVAVCLPPTGDNPARPTILWSDRHLPNRLCPPKDIRGNILREGKNYENTPQNTHTLYKSRPTTECLKKIVHLGNKPKKVNQFVFINYTSVNLHLKLWRQRGLIRVLFAWKPWGPTDVYFLNTNSITFFEFQSANFFLRHPVLLLYLLAVFRLLWHLVLCKFVDY